MKATIELLYFTSKTYGVCKVLKPKLLEAIQENFPEVKIRVVEGALAITGWRRINFNSIL